MNDYWREINSIHFLDVGCSGSLDRKWYMLAPLLNYVGFDPNKAECERLNQQPHTYKSATYYPYAIAGEEGTKTMYKTKSIFCYSLLRPNHNWLKRFSFHSLFQEIGEEEIECTTLNGLVAKESLQVDIIKLDTQGLELPILKSGSDLLNDAFCVETETGFCENYIGETTYSQIDEFMRAKGFLLFDLKIHRVSRDNHFMGIGKHQPLWCEAIWLFDYIGQNKVPSLQLAIKVLLICKSLQYYDYGLELAKYFKENMILDDDMFTFFQDPKNWTNMQLQPVSKVGKILRFFPKIIQEKLLFGLQEILD